jgi:hypothetical protein
MNHLKEEELVEHYYSLAGQSDIKAAAASSGSGAKEDPEATAHLAECGTCARAFSSLKNDLADIAILEPPARDDTYSERVWRSIAPSLPAYEKRKRAWMGIQLWPGLAYAAACAVMVVSAFFAGRVWEQRQPHTVAVTTPTQPPVPRHAVVQHVVVVVLSDHLDRSERFLVQLKHADVDNTELARPLSEEARSLLAANHICRKKAEEAKDPELNTALDHLDELLGKLANQPGGLNPAALAEVQKEMKSENLLFEVRVLRSRVPGGQNAHSAGSKGATV